jgi:hypothetical protein
MNFELVLANKCRLYFLYDLLLTVQCGLDALVVFAKCHLRLPRMVHRILVEGCYQALEYPESSWLVPKF